MVLRLCTDLAPASWLESSQLPDWDLVVRGPGGYDAYARLRFVPDPAFAGQSENDAAGDADLPSELEQLRSVLSVLRRHTTTPEDWYFAIWEGWGQSAFPVSVRSAARLHLPSRDYLLLTGSVDEYGTWMTPDRPEHFGWRERMPVPAFTWPADRAWYIANDVDPHFAVITAGQPVIDEVLAAVDLDVVPYDLQRGAPFFTA